MTHNAEDDMGQRGGADNAQTDSTGSGDGRAAPGQEGLLVAAYHGIHAVVQIAAGNQRHQHRHQGDQHRCMAINTAIGKNCNASLVTKPP